jgi:outer membrane protein TolC
MKNRRRISLLVLGLTGAASVVHGQTITREEFLNELKQVHPLFEKERLTAQIETEEQASHLGAQDWNVRSSAAYAHEEPAIALLGPERTDAISVTGGVEKVFWGTGGRLSASLSASRADLKIDPSFGFPESYYQNQLAVSYAHPLLRNRNGFLDRLAYDLRQFDIDFSEVQAAENQEEFLASAAAKFMNWVFLTEQRSIILERLGLSEEELDRTKRKRDANLVDQADVIRAEDAVRIWRQNQVLVESQWNALQAELAVLLQNDELYARVPEFELYEFEELVPLEEAVPQLEEHSRLLRSLAIRLNQLELSRRGYVETSKPDLSLVAELNTKNADEGFGESLKMDKPDAVVGVQLSFPLENRTATSKIAKTDLQIAQLKTQMDEVAVALASALTSLHIQVSELEEVLALNQEQIESAKERTEEELKLYNQGRGELTFVIQSRDNEQNAKLTLAQNALTYHKLLIEYRALTDQLFE